MNNARHEQDLRWYLGGWADGEMGLQSSMQATINAIELGCPPGGFNVTADFMPDAALKAAGRERRVRTALRRTAPEARRVILAAYSPGALRVAGWGAGAEAGVVLLTAEAHRAHDVWAPERPLVDWLAAMARASLRNPAAATTTAQLATAARTLLAKALTAYARETR